MAITLNQVKTWLFLRYPELNINDPDLMLSLEGFINDAISEYCEKRYRNNTLKVVSLSAAHDFYFNNAAAIDLDGGAGGGSGAATPPGGPITRRKEGDIEINYGTLSGSTSEQNSYLSKTKYGQQLDNLLKKFKPVGYPIIIK